MGLYYPSIRKKRKTFAPKRNKIISEEVGLLLEAGHIRKVLCTIWIANMVFVPKKGGKWRVYIDYINPNKSFKLFQCGRSTFHKCIGNPPKASSTNPKMGVEFSFIRKLF